MQILIFGMHRSGTSMTTRLVNMMGASLGPGGITGEITDANPKGFWERPEVFKLNEYILETKGCSWFDLRNWSFSEAESCPTEQNNQIKQIIEDMDTSQPWVLKDPRMCLLFPAWRKYLKSPIAVIAHRSPFEIAISLNKRNNFPIEFGVALWEHYAVGLLNATRGLPRTYIRYGDVHFMPHRHCECLYNDLTNMGVSNLHLPTLEEVGGFIDSSLYRSKMPRPGYYKLSDHQRILVKMCRGLLEQGDDVQISEESAEIIRSHTPPTC